MTVLLRVEGVSKRFGGLSALSDVSIEVSEGSITGLIGPNGSGKTTLVNVLTGIYTADQGWIEFKGKRIERFPAWRIANMGIARTFQNNQLFRSMTVLENVMVGCHAKAKGGFFSEVVGTALARGQRELAESRARGALEMVGIDEGLMGQAVTALPYGKQKLVELARAIAGDPELLLLDEPAAGLNPQEKAELVTLLRRLNQTGKTILLIEHNMKVVVELCDRVVVLSFGKKIAEGSPQEVMENDEVISAYLGKGGFIAAS